MQRRLYIPMFWMLLAFILNLLACNSEQIDIVGSVSLVFLKKEQVLEIWEDNIESAKLLKKHHISIPPSIPVGIFSKKSILLEQQKIVVNPINDFYKNKLQTYDLPFFEKFEIQKDTMLFNHIAVSNDILSTIIGHNIKEIIIVPNDIRNDAKFVSCITCPHWMAELYVALEMKLQHFRGI